MTDRIENVSEDSPEASVTATRTDDQATSLSEGPPLEPTSATGIGYQSTGDAGTDRANAGITSSDGNANLSSGSGEAHTVIIPRPATGGSITDVPATWPEPSGSTFGSAAESATTVLPAAGRRVPQRIPPTPTVSSPPRTTLLPRVGKKKVGIAAVVALAAVIIGVVIVTTNSGDNSPQGQIRHAITSYADALKGGNLQTLRQVTTGRLGAYYQRVSAQEFATVYQASVREKSIPTIDGVDAISIKGKTARAQVTATLPDQAGQKVPRSFELTDTDSGWKIAG